MQTSKPLFLLLMLIATATALGYCVCGLAGIQDSARDGAIAAAIGVTAVIAALLPLRLSSDREPAILFQSAWIGSILHLAAFVVLGAGVIFISKSGTAFVVWLLAMYWLTLAGLCAVMVGVMRGASPHVGGTATQAK